MIAAINTQKEVIEIKIIIIKIIASGLFLFGFQLKIFKVRI